MDKVYKWADNSWRAAAWALERLNPAVYGKPDPRKYRPQLGEADLRAVEDLAIELAVREAGERYRERMTNTLRKPLGKLISQLVKRPMCSRIAADLDGNLDDEWEEEEFEEDEYEEEEGSEEGGEEGYEEESEDEGVESTELSSCDGPSAERAKTPEITKESINALLDERERTAPAVGPPSAAVRAQFPKLASLPAENKDYSDADVATELESIKEQQEQCQQDIAQSRDDFNAADSEQRAVVHEHRRTLFRAFGRLCDRKRELEALRRNRNAAPAATSSTISPSVTLPAVAPPPASVPTTSVADGAQVSAPDDIDPEFAAQQAEQKEWVELRVIQRKREEVNDRMKKVLAEQRGCANPSEMQTAMFTLEQQDLLKELRKLFGLEQQVIAARTAQEAPAEGPAAQQPVVEPAPALAESALPGANYLPKPPYVTFPSNSQVQAT